jgi:uncharacterized protein (TIGR03435 family)
MRLMMQSLLAARFKLAVHFETREAPALVLTLANPGKPGPQLRPHSEGPPCPEDNTTPDPKPGTTFLTANVFPPTCGTAMVLRSKGLTRTGSRNIAMPLIADLLSGALGDKPVVDRTGLKGAFDFTLEYTEDTAPSPDGQPPSAGTPLSSALREQLGLKVASSREPVRMFLIDHVARPSEN